MPGIDTSRFIPEQGVPPQGYIPPEARRIDPNIKLEQARERAVANFSEQLKKREKQITPVDAASQALDQGFEGRQSEADLQAIEQLRKRIQGLPIK